MAITQIDGGRQIRAATVTNAEIAAAANIATTKLAEGSDFVKRTGTVAYTADQSHGGFKITNLAAGVSATDAVNKAQLDASAGGFDQKGSVRAATTASGALASAFANGSIIDGITLATGNRILIKDQTTGSENGIYTVNASGAPTRATDADTSAKVTSGMYVFVSEGTTNTSQGWALVTIDTIVLGTTSLVFTQVSGLGQITAGAGLTKTGNSLDVIGTASRIVVSADSIDIGTDVVTLTGAQTLTNKTIAGSQISGNIPGNSANVTGTVAIANGGTGQTTKAPAFDALSPLTTAGDILIGGAAGTGSRLAASATAGQVLTSNGAGVAPSYQATATSTSFKATTITGTQNGTNPTFTLGVTPSPAGSEQVITNGAILNPGAGNDYTISGATVTFLTTMIPVSTDTLRAYASS